MEVLHFSPNRYAAKVWAKVVHDLGNSVPLDGVLRLDSGYEKAEKCQLLGRHVYASVCALEIVDRVLR